MSKVLHSPSLAVPDGTAVIQSGGAWYRLLWNDSTAMIAPEVAALTETLPQVGLVEWEAPDEEVAALVLDVVNVPELPGDDDYE